MKRLLLLLCFLALLKGSAYSQDSLGLGSNYANLGLPDTVAIGDSVNYSIYLKNWSPNIFFGTVFINMAIDTSAGLQFVGWLDSLTVQLSPGDTIGLNYNDTIPSGLFRIGGNIIVIWPAAINAGTKDSVTATIYVLPASSVGEITDKDHIKVYPNPTPNEVQILQDRPNNDVVRVRIYNALGEEVLVVEHSAIIDLRALPAGTYLAKAEFADKTRSSFKIVKR
ncbi:MAG: T9SS type A sorting domain-containing protein [Bacteroidota bacterium]